MQAKVFENISPYPLGPLALVGIVVLAVAYNPKPPSLQCCANARQVAKLRIRRIGWITLSTVSIDPEAAPKTEILCRPHVMVETLRNVRDVLRRLPDTFQKLMEHPRVRLVTLCLRRQDDRIEFDADCRNIGVDDGRFRV